MGSFKQILEEAPVMTHRNAAANQMDLFEVQEGTSEIFNGMQRILQHAKGDDLLARRLRNVLRMYDFPRSINRFTRTMQHLSREITDQINQMPIRR